MLPPGVSASWLRASCPCRACLDPGSGQRLVNITDQPADVSFRSVTEGAGSYHVTFGPDGHRAEIGKSWLAAALAPERAGRTEDAKRLWVAADFPDGPARMSWTRCRAGGEDRASCLESLLTDGFVLLTGVPATPGMVLDVAASMGFVRETNYGRLFDVRATVDPANLAFTPLAIAPHTDNPYRDPVPTVQLLHCLASAAEGGDSGLVDGFAAASLLRAEEPAAFATLTGTPVTFRYADKTADLQATMPMIGLDPRGRIREVRFNNRSLQPLRAPGGPPEPAAADAFYRAYRAFAGLLARPELMLTFRLEPGDCVVFDNTRVLHARTAFTARQGPGHRHLQGCYADLDGVASELAVLRREEEIQG
ncbi:MAG TPA: TauD/TfdA family dioxygenase [Streptosporangiaceae bacterium]|nr:TauD/TfdA family dioxygenase [Streptosporangiaceae bacterium]